MLGLDSRNNKTLDETHGDGVIARAPDTALSDIERAVVKAVIGVLLRQRNAEVAASAHRVSGDSNV